MSVIKKVKTMLGADHSAKTALESSEPPLTIEMSDPGPDTDTCRITLNRELSPDKTEFFETYGEAKDWPMVQRVMRISGVHSVIVKANILIVAKHASVPWSQLLQPIEEALRVGFDPTAVEHDSPVDAIAAAVSGQGPNEDLRHRVQEILDSEINPSVAGHGGFISLLDVQGTRVFVHMGGGCQGCEMASATLKHGVETALRAQIPEITEILDTTDHAAGENPYFQG